LKAAVVDNSVVLSWVFEDEHNKKSKKILKDISIRQAYVPSLWSYELANALFIAERKGRIKEADSRVFIDSLKNLPISIEKNTYENITKDILSISREHQITVYDASYVELAMRKNLGIFSFDKLLNKVCQKVGVKVL